jgi:hypothetical protein
MSVDLDYEHQATLAQDHIDGLHGVDHPACPVCRHPSMRRPGCAWCTRYVTIHGTHEDHLRAIGWEAL